MKTKFSNSNRKSQRMTYEKLDKLLHEKFKISAKTIEGGGSQDHPLHISMSTYVSAGEEPQEYNPDNGQYGGSGKDKAERFRELERKYNDDLPIGLSKKQYSPKLDSAVMNKYSTVRKRVSKKGAATIKVNDGKNFYIVRINKSDNDFDYDILKVWKIND